MGLGGEHKFYSTLLASSFKSGLGAETGCCIVLLGEMLFEVFNSLVLVGYLNLASVCILTITLQSPVGCSASAGVSSAGVVGVTGSFTTGAGVSGTGVSVTGDCSSFAGFSAAFAAIRALRALVAASSLDGWA